MADGDKKTGKSEGKRRRARGPHGPKRANVELFLAARHLPNRDLASRTDPYVEVYIKTVGLSKEDRLLGQTEIIRDNLNPRWSKSFVVEYYFERVQVLSFKIWDYDGKKQKAQFVGKAQCELGEVMGAKGQALAVELDEVEVKKTPKKPDPTRALSKTDSVFSASLKKLTGGKKSEILIYADEVGKGSLIDSSIGGHSYESLISWGVEELEKLAGETPATVKKVDKSLKLSWSGENLDKMDIGGTSDPFMKIAIQRRGGGQGEVVDTKAIGGFEVEVHKSEVVKKTLNPKWNPVEIPLEKLCNNILNTNLYISCWDWDLIGKDDLIGSFTITAKTLIEATPGTTFELINEEKKKGKGNYTNSGKIVIGSVDVLSTETDIPNKDVQLIQDLITKKKTPDAGGDFGSHDDFVRYLAGGCELSIIFAIDFTGSNRKYDTPNSLHSLSGLQPNPYQQVIKVVGHIVQHYSSDKKFPVYGYAAGIAPSGKTLPAFNLAGFLDPREHRRPREQRQQSIIQTPTKSSEETTTSSPQQQPQQQQQKSSESPGSSSTPTLEKQDSEEAPEEVIDEKKVRDPLDLNTPCRGIDMVLKAYSAAVPKLVFGDMGQVLKPDGKAYKGDDFYQLIDIAVDKVGEISQEKQKYALLLLVIDGDYVDIKATVDAIVRAGKAPISIIIIGVGNGDFLNCIKLDADDAPLVSSTGEKACRDVVQFVKYNDYKNDVEALGAKVLEELPTQFIEFMRLKGYNPNNRVRQDI